MQELAKYVIRVVCTRKIGKTTCIYLRRMVFEGTYQICVRYHMQVLYKYAITYQICYWYHMQVFAKHSIPLLGALQILCQQLWVTQNCAKFPAYLIMLEGTAIYAALLLSTAEGFGRGFFCPSGKKRHFNAVSAYFRPFLVFSSNFSNF